MELSDDLNVNNGMGPRDEIIARLRQLPEVLGKTDGEIAEILGIPQQAWSNYKAEKIQVTIRPMVALAMWDAFGIPMEWVYDGQTARTPDPDLRAKLVAANRRADAWLASRRPSGSGRTTRIAILVVAGAILLGSLQNAGLAWTRTDGLPIGLLQYNADRLACRGEAQDHVEHPLLGDSEDAYAAQMATIYIGCMSEKGYTPNGDWYKP